MLAPDADELPRLPFSPQCGQLPEDRLDLVATQDLKSSRTSEIEPIERIQDGVPVDRSPPGEQMLILTHSIVVLQVKGKEPLPRRRYLVSGAHSAQIAVPDVQTDTQVVAEAIDHRDHLCDGDSWPALASGRHVLDGHLHIGRASALRQNRQRFARSCPVRSVFLHRERIRYTAVGVADDDLGADFRCVAEAVRRRLYGRATSPFIGRAGVPPN